MTMQNKEKDWFGYKKVNPSDKTKMVEGVFDNVASRYDLMNDLMSGGIHRLWKNRFVQMMHPRANRKLLDVAGGTGDIAFRYRKAAGESAKITVCDINKEMLKVGRNRAIDRGYLKGFEWVEGNAESLPFDDREFHLYSIAFGLRNVTHIDNALADAYRVLKPGGQFFCLEFSHLKNAALQKVYDEYSFRIIPKIGEIVAKDRDSYQYLVESIRQFPKQAELSARLETAGFENVKVVNLSGGIAAIHIGNKL
ncbi:MAG: bifunctional demethylmenaquinone methyltransferase/2-methoxy-6-polyprenyl-1,4-benzoquinol methylase UbiE [Alphaproteobacteria bacterium]|nr:bifunctional demethylmenaquinone methyltransferase/2-methoxy-6-polyprenyl-1,4-benzoquinol methylase UbiE [Alphaproteobacteria bacterium]